MSYDLTPLAVCEELFGGRTAFERAIGVKPKLAYSWSRGAQWRAPGDLPSYVQRNTLKAVRKMKLDIDPKWLIEGATRAEIDEALQQARRIRAAMAA
ncbi:MAG: hypothetical protein AAFY81_10415 [Pseudomonadota bacterium]